MKRQYHMKSFSITLGAVLALSTSVPLVATTIPARDLTADVHLGPGTTDQRELLFLNISPWEVLLKITGDPSVGDVGATHSVPVSNDSTGQQSQKFLTDILLPGASASNGSTGTGSGPESLLRLDDPSSMLEESSSAQAPRLSNDPLPVDVFLPPNDHGLDSFKLLDIQNHNGVSAVQLADPTNAVAEPRWPVQLLAAFLIAGLLLRARRARRPRLGCLTPHSDLHSMI
jgi:hypothetical protein